MKPTMRKNDKSIENQLLLKAYKNPKFQGKEVVIVGGKMHVLSMKSREARAKLLISLTKGYPQSIPMIALIPKENTLILLL